MKENDIDIQSRAPRKSSWAPPPLPRRGLERIPLLGNVFRLARLLRVEGASGASRRAARLSRRWIRRVRGRRPLRDLLEELGRSERSVVVFASTVDWHIVLFQRPQQLARAFAALGHSCLYVTPNEVDDVAGVERIGPDLYLVDRLEPCLHALDRGVLIVPSPTPARFDPAAVRRARKAARGRLVVVYDFLDAIHPAISSVSPARRAAHEELLRTADLVTASARSLEKEARGRRQDVGPVLLVPNAADLEHFRPREVRGSPSGRGADDVPGRPELPEDMRWAGDSPGAIIGYSGALARWIDYDLLREVAVRRPDWRLVLVGWDFDGSLGESHVLDLPNVRFLGPKPYETLPAYVAVFDVAILPFRIDDVTVATSPIKLFEYMAARKPIVATDLPECRGYESVSIGVGPGAFVACLERALELRSKPEALAALDREAEANTWTHRARRILAAIDELPRTNGTST